MDDKIHSAAIEHLPFFITAPGQTDVLFNAMAIFMLVAVLAVGNLYFQLHAIPERMAHRTNRVQMEIVAVLALISLFTHIQLFWIAALLLALIQFPDFSTPIGSIAESLRKLADRRAGHDGQASVAGAPPGVTHGAVHAPGDPEPHAAAQEPDRQAPGLTPDPAPEATHIPKEGN